MESFINIDWRIFSTRFNIRYPQDIGQVLTLLLRHLPQVHQVNLIGHENHRVRVLVLDAQNERVEVAYVGEAGLVGDRVDEQEGVALAHVLLAHRRELLLAGGVEHVQNAPLAVRLGVLDVGVLDRRVVVLHEHLLKELDSQR